MPGIEFNRILIKKSLPLLYIKVVAGMNYEVIVNVTSDNKCKVYRAVVFKSLAGKLILSSSEKIGNKCY
jgi:hypothetical protein